MAENATGVPPPPSTPPQSQSFELFSDLDEGLKGKVLSYVADAPFETTPHHCPRSSLTHQLPTVNRQFRSLCNGDLLWRDAVLRMLEKEPALWKMALHNVCGSNADDKNGETSEKLVERAHRFLQKHQPEKSSYKSIYETVVNRHLRFRGPVFYMPYQVALGERYALHLFEPRYRILIAQVMEGQPAEARRGGRLLAQQQRPACFVHAHRAPLEPTAPAVLVEVVQCHMFPDGRANVVLLPVRYVRLERIEVRPDQGNLFHAQALRMGRAMTEQLERLQRQEALASVVSSHQRETGSDDGTSESDE